MYGNDDGNAFPALQGEDCFNKRGAFSPGSEEVMSRPRTNPPDPCTIIRLPMALEARVTVLAKQAQSTVQDYVIEVVTEWLSEHRSGRPPVVPDEDYTRRAGTDWDKC